MIELHYGPAWFNIGAILIDFIGIVVLFLLGLFSFKYYNINKGKGYLKLGISFWLICVSFIFKMFTNVANYYVSFMDRDLGGVNTVLETVRSYNIVSNLSFLFMVFFGLLGLYVLYSVYQTRQPRSNSMLIVYFILILTYFSSPAYYLFHLTSFILLLLITIQFYNRYLKAGHNRTKLLSYGFGIIALSQAAFMFIGINQYIYVISELIQLIGYVLLLLVLVMVLSHGKKKNKD